MGRLALGAEVMCCQSAWLGTGELERAGQNRLEEEGPMLQAGADLGARVRRQQKLARQDEMTSNVHLEEERTLQGVRGRPVPTKEMA